MSDIIPAQQTALRPSATPADLVRIALESNADLDRLERLMRMQQEWEAQQARKAYVAAMSAFKQDPPTIFKAKRVAFDTSKGRTEYMHATIGDVTQPVIEGLAKVGISHRWDVQQPDGGMIQVTCILTHEQGHSESVTMRAGRDESGGKNNIQAVASTITYLERYTLLSITGLATHDLPDDDGRAAEQAPTKSAAVAANIKPVKLDDVLAAYKAVATPADMTAADEQAARLSDAEKEVAKAARKKRLAELRTPKASPSDPFVERMRSATTQEERDTVMSESVGLAEDERAKVEAVWLELKTE